MESTQISINQLILMGIAVGGVVGLLVGLVPFFIGRRYGNPRLGLYGLLGTTVAGMILSLVTAVPTAAIFSWIIIRKAKLEAGTDGPANQPEA